MTYDEMKSLYKSNYRQILALLKIAKYEKPESYKDLADFVEQIRDYTADVSNIGDLPQVPKD